MKRPVLNDVLKNHGQKSVFEYLKGYIAKKYIPTNSTRQQELIDVVRKETESRLGKEAADSVAEQLKEYYYVSTTDHYGPIYHPWVFNFNMIASAVCAEDGEPALKNIITLACANVSLNNFSFPRGFAFHSDITGKNNLNRFSFLPSNAHSYPVYGFRGYNVDEINKVKKSLKDAVAKKDIRAEEERKANSILDEIYAKPELFGSEYYADQITKTNFALWNKMVPKIGPKKINFVYLEQEWIVTRLLIEKHLGKRTTVSRILYDEKSEELLMKYFAGLPESFSRREKLGTYLFWAQPKGDKTRHRLRLWKEGNLLMSEDRSYKVELTPEALEKALISKELVPSVLLTFIVLCFYYGLKCLGGLGQINYLPLLKQAYIKMQNDLERYESAAACEKTETDNLGGEITVALLSSKTNGTAPATSWDFLIHDKGDAWKIFERQTKQITLEEAIVPMFTEDYPIIYPLNERHPALAAITAKDITRLMNLDKKIRPCVSM